MDTSCQIHCVIHYSRDATQICSSNIDNPAPIVPAIELCDRNTSLFYINSGSIKNKYNYLNDYISTHDYMIL